MADGAVAKAAPDAAPPTPAIPEQAAGGFAAPPLKADGQIDWPRLFLAFFAMTLGQFMAMLDIQIVASSLPQIQAGISASADEVSWIQTAYLIPEVVMIPLSGYLSRLWGTQKLFMASCAGFTIMSVLTGMSSSIEAMIVTRALQGFIGGAMIPTVFAIAFTAFPPDKRATSGAIMGLIVSLAPTIGPTLGGHLTEWLNWRWLFFVNVVPGALVLILVGRYGDLDKGDPALAKGFDWFGLASMAAFLMSLQYVLEEGNRKGWFEDDTIVGLAALAAVSGVLFIWRQVTYRQPIIQVKALKDINFSLGLIINFCNGATVFGGTFLIPLFLGRVQHFSSAQVGTTMLVSGVTMLMIAPVAGRVVRMFDPRIPLVLGLLIAAIGVWTGHAVTANWTFWDFAWMQALRSFGVMLAMIAGQMLAMSTIDPMLMKSASSLLNLFRNTGGAVALALLSSQLTRSTAEHMNALTSAVSVSSGQAQAMMAGLAHRMGAMGAADPQGAARKAFNYMIFQDAQVLAFADGFALMAALCLAATLLALIARPGSLQAQFGGSPAFGPKSEPAH
ncbi:MAG TPA: DHA2 family efflux MFS transporter permease subunit [Caulobacteraceae bacterium]|nr:DHA2 family efflux MFS transporter permease subunit [Caulobacteraceae bacterium]